MAMITARNLTKVYDNSVVAVDHISFEAEAGEIFGFVGPNGAGKTTTVRMLTTLTKPSAGTAEVRGFDLQRDPRRIREIIGVVPQDFSVDDDLTARENLSLQSRLYHLPRAEAKARTERLLELVSLADSADAKVRTYSGGMRKRLEVICGLLSDPKVLFLDEPTLGLDVRSRKAIWDYLKNLNRESKLTLFLTTNYMEEADSLCDRITIIDKGRIVASGTPDALKASVGEDIFELTVSSGSSQTEELLKSLDSVLAVRRVDELTYQADVKVAEDKLSDILHNLGAAKVRVLKIISKRPELDDVFLHYTGRDFKTEASQEERVQRAQRTMRRIGT